MKIKLDNEGFLFISRGGIFKQQLCPYRARGTACGDWCPKLGELEIESENMFSEELNDTVIDICDSCFVLKSKDFIDERPDK